MIFTFTDYGHSGLYLGQVEAVIDEIAPCAKVVHLLNDAPRQNPVASSYLLSAYSSGLGKNSILFCVVDPGVGSDRDRPVALKLDDQWFVGPNNGLFDIVARRASTIEAWELKCEGRKLSNTFHGRDLYAPACAHLALGDMPDAQPVDWQERQRLPDDLLEIIYIDHFGNCLSGLRAGELDSNAVLQIGNTRISAARTFSDVSPGEMFWYANANGLVEIAANCADAAAKLDLVIGADFSVL